MRPVLMISLFFATAITGFAQTKTEKEVIKLAFKNEPVEIVSTDRGAIESDITGFKNEPVEIVSLKNSSRPMNFGEKFIQQSDWLKDFTVEVKNKSGKAITYIRVALRFPETKAIAGNTLNYPLVYGQVPLEIGKAYNGEPAVEPNGIIKLEVTEKSYAGLKSFVEKRLPLDDLSQVEVMIGYIQFDDGTAWGAGNFMRPDSNNPGKYIPIDSK